MRSVFSDHQSLRSEAGFWHGGFPPSAIAFASVVESLVYGVKHDDKLNAAMLSRRTAEDLLVEGGYVDELLTDVYASNDAEVAAAGPPEKNASDNAEDATASSSALAGTDAGCKFSKLQIVPLHMDRWFICNTCDACACHHVCDLVMLVQACF